MSWIMDSERRGKEKAKLEQEALEEKKRLATEHLLPFKSKVGEVLQDIKDAGYGVTEGPTDFDRTNESTNLKEIVDEPYFHAGPSETQYAVKAFNTRWFISFDTELGTTTVKLVPTKSLEKTRLIVTDLYFRGHNFVTLDTVQSELIRLLSHVIEIKAKKNILKVEKTDST